MALTSIIVPIALIIGTGIVWVVVRAIMEV